MEPNKKKMVGPIERGVRAFIVEANEKTMYGMDWLSGNSRRVPGKQGKLRTFLQVVVVECKDLDEITTEEQLRFALPEQWNLEVPMQIQIRKAFGKRDPDNDDWSTDGCRKPADEDRQDRSRMIGLYTDSHSSSWKTGGEMLQLHWVI